MVSSTPCKIIILSNKHIPQLVFGPHRVGGGSKNDPPFFGVQNHESFVFFILS